MVSRNCNKSLYVVLQNADMINDDKLNDTYTEILILICQLLLKFIIIILTSNVSCKIYLDNTSIYSKAHYSSGLNH